MGNDIGYILCSDHLSMYLSDVLASLRRGMRVRVWAETIWPGSKAVAIIYNGVFETLTKEYTQPAFSRKEQNKKQIDCVTYPLYGEPYVGSTLDVMVLINASSTCSVDQKMRRYTKTQIVIHTITGAIRIPDSLFVCMFSLFYFLSCVFLFIKYLIVYPMFFQHALYENAKEPL